VSRDFRACAIDGRPTNDSPTISGERNWLFTFLYCPGLDATNDRAEQAIRPAVVTRKVWGGNRTPPGAHTQEILASVLRTCYQRKLSAQAVLIHLLCSAQPPTLNLAACDLSLRACI
jgi:hypothetical protein